MANILIAHLIIPILGWIKEILIIPFLVWMKEIFFTSLFNAERNVEEMKNAAEDLKHMSNRVTANKDRNNQDQKSNWNEKVNDVLKDVEKISKGYKMRGGYVSGQWSLRFWTVYIASTKAQATKAAIDALVTEGSQYDTPVEIPEVPESKLEDVVGMELHEEELEKYINDKEIRIVGIWGMGGVGKSTLLRIIKEKYVSKPKPFDHIIWAKAHAAIGEEQVAKLIAKDLHLPEDTDADAIRKYLENKSFLVLLDNLWQRVDLKNIGVPDINSSNKRRMLVFTTRSRDVCKGMQDVKWLKIECLDSDNARKFFKDKLGKDIVSKKALERKIEYVADNCHGLPLALFVIGAAMCDKDEYEDWESALTSLRQPIPKGIPETEKTMFPILKLSYSNLKTINLKHCFLSCTLWPRVDPKIKKQDLISCWLGLGLIEFRNAIDAYRQGEDLIRDLQRACLLETTSLEDEVEMHDLIRSLATWITQESRPKWMTRNRSPEKWQSAERVSLMGKEIDELPIKFDRCDKLSVLMLNETSIRVIPSGFFGSTPNLTYLDLSKTKITSLPNDIRALRKLEYLNLSDTNIESLPKELTQLTELKYLLLRDTRVKVLSDSVISSMKSLKILDVFPKTSIDSESAKYLQHRLGALGTLTSTAKSLKTLRSLPTRWLRVQGLEGQKSLELQNLSSNKGKYVKVLEVVSCDELEQLVMKQACLRNLRHLRIESCPKLENLSWILQLESLADLTVVSCSGITQICSDSKDGYSKDKSVVTEPSTCSLRVLKLEKLKKLSSICDPGAVTFPSLKSVSITDCDNLKSLPKEIEIDMTK